MLIFFNDEFMSVTLALGKSIFTSWLGNFDFPNAGIIFALFNYIFLLASYLYQIHFLEEFQFQLFYNY